MRVWNLRNSSVVSSGSYILVKWQETARVEFETRHRRQQAFRLFVHSLARRAQFFDERGVLLGDFVHLYHRYVHLLDAKRLLLRGGRDLSNGEVCFTIQ